MTTTINLPQSVIKRLEKVAASSRRSPSAIVKQAIADRLEYEEWFSEQVQEGIADEKAGRVHDKSEFWAQLDKARNERKKAA